MSWAVLLLGTAWAQTSPGQLPNTLEGPARGVGVALGTPTGLALSWRPSDAMAVQSAVGWSFQQDQFNANADYVITVAELPGPDDSIVFPAYIGAGARLRLDGDDDDTSNTNTSDQSTFGLRIPAGLRMVPEDLRLDAFIEVAPVVVLFPDTQASLDFGLGFRFWLGPTEG